MHPALLQAQVDADKQFAVVVLVVPSLRTVPREPTAR
jgi:hypothetical protein